MNLETEKKIIQSEIEDVDDVRLIEAIKNLLAYGKAKRYEQNLSPMSKAVFYERNKVSRKAISSDNLIAHEEALSYLKNNDK
ncbi:MAG: hypothetical protein WD016_12445 [Balneolaceae bacterium]